MVIISDALHFTFIDSTNASAIGAFDSDIISQCLSSESTNRHSETAQQSSRRHTLPV
jgi:hypothetical protein